MAVLRDGSKAVFDQGNELLEKIPTPPHRSAYQGSLPRAATIPLKNIRGQFSQLGSLPFLQLDVGGNGLFAKLADDVIKAVG